MISPTLTWILLGLALAVLEILVPGFVLIFFGIAAVIVGGLVGIGVLPTLWLQVLVFAILSVVLLVVARRFFKGLFAGKVSEDASAVEDDFIGQKVRVVEAITADKEGKIEFKGSAWSANSNESHQPGDMVLIVDRNNLTVTVEAV